MSDLEDAEAKLKELEKHIHAAAISHYKAKRAERYMHDYAGEPEEFAKFKAEMEKHKSDRDTSLDAHRASGVTSRHIDTAAQAVIDAREVTNENA
jgi:uncharacterized protein YceH (UPF0502 family)